MGLKPRSKGLCTYSRLKPGVIEIAFWVNQNRAAYINNHRLQPMVCQQLLLL